VSRWPCIIYVVMFVLSLGSLNEGQYNDVVNTANSNYTYN